MLFYFEFEGNFPSTSPWGAYIWRVDLTEGFLHHRFEGLIFGGAYTWRGLFSEFYGMFIHAIPISFAPAQKPYRIGLLFIYNGQTRFATTIFSATQHYNIVATLFRTAAILFQHCNACSAKNRRCESSRVTSPLESTTPTATAAKT